jgi:hypothetical protein
VGFVFSAMMMVQVGALLRMIWIMAVLVCGTHGTSEHEHEDAIWVDSYWSAGMRESSRHGR